MSQRPNKRRRRNKKRTEVSSDSSSDSDLNTESPSAHDDHTQIDTEEPAMDQSIEQDIIPQYDESPDQMDNQPHDPKQSIPMELLNHSLDDQQFEQFYLQQVTQEFGDDLDKLRQSKDFNDNSLVLLIDALKQGVNIFDEEQRAVILNH